MFKSLPVRHLARPSPVAEGRLVGATIRKQPKLNQIVKEVQAIKSPEISEDNRNLLKGLAKHQIGIADGTQDSRIAEEDQDPNVKNIVSF